MQRRAEQRAAYLSKQVHASRQAARALVLLLHHTCCAKS